MKTRKLIERIALTIFVFSLLAGIYIILVSFFRVETLIIQLWTIAWLSYSVCNWTDREFNKT